MADLLAATQYHLKSFKRGNLVAGTIVSVTGKEVLIDVGGKTEGVVGEKEWPQIRDFVSQLKPGDQVTGVVISTENDRGQLVLSLRKAGSTFRWKRAAELLTSGETINVRGLEVNKGGLLVDFEGMRGFLPGSQLMLSYQGDLTKLINKVLQVKVIEADEKQNRLVFSQKAVVVAADVGKRLEEIRAKVSVGQRYPGKVSAVAPYGVFVNLDNGTDGLVHISEVSWHKVDDLTKLYPVGDLIEVMALGINEDDGKLNLSIKQLLPDPWTKVAEKFAKDQIVTGQVSKVTQHGVFVRLDDGVEGLIRISKIPPTVTINEGEKISCVVESVDVVNHRISLLPVLTEKPVLYK